MNFKKTISCLLAFLPLFSCNEFLEEKADRSFAVPDNIRDLAALLDNEDRVNLVYPEGGDIASDYYFLREAEWLSRNENSRRMYVWQSDAQYPIDWNNAYQKIFLANVVLDQIDNANLRGYAESDRDRLKGTALFLRGWTNLLLSQLYTTPYQLGDEDSPFGLPLKLKADINETVERSTVKETYDQIADDLLQASSLLPASVSIRTRPDKAVAHAALARLYLILGDYRNAVLHADVCLSSRGNEILDYNTVNGTPAQPFLVLNTDVLFHAVNYSISGVHAQSRAFVDTTLVSQYADDDLRKSLFFRRDASGYSRFLGTYEGGTIAIFGGISIPEVYLIKAEGEARLSNLDSAKGAMAVLFQNRFTTAGQPDLISLDRDDLLDMIITERQKELLFRGGVRWSDLRRLNREPRYARTLRRTIGSETYTLPPNDLRYTLLIPTAVIEMSGMAQNPR